MSAPRVITRRKTADELQNQTRLKTKIEILLLVLLFLVVTAITLFRIGIGNYDSANFEDGTIFLSRALEHPMRALFQPYAGYVHFIPSFLTSILITFFPPSSYAYGIVFGCAVLISGMSIAGFWLSRDLIPSQVARLGLALIPSCMPLVVLWVNGCISQIHVYLPWFLIWVILARYKSFWSSTLFGLAAFAAVTTAPETFILAPVAIWVLFRRNRKSWPMLAGCVSGAVVQCYGMITEPFIYRFPMEIGLPSIFQGWLRTGILPLVVGDENTQRSILLESGLLVPTSILLLFIALVVWIILTGTLEQTLLAIGLLLGSFAAYALSAVSNGSVPIDFANHPIGEGWYNSRYGITPGLLLVSIMPLFAAVLYEKRRRIAQFRARRISSTIAIATMLITFIFAWQGLPSPRASGAVFSTAITDLEEKCKTLPFDLRIGLFPATGGNEAFLQCSWLPASADLQTIPPPTCSSQSTVADSVGTPGRIAGSDRYEIAVQISRMLYQRSCRVYLVSDPINAIMVAPLARASSAAILLTDTATLPAVVKAEISRLQPTEIVIADKSIKFNVYLNAKTLAAPGAIITNTSMKNLDMTEFNLINHFIQRDTGGFKTNRYNNVYLATASNPTNAFALANLAATEGAPFILIPNEQVRLPDFTTNLLNTLKPLNKIVIVGDTNSISQFIETQLQHIAPTKRLTGQNQFADAAIITALGWKTQAKLSADKGYIVAAESIAETATIAQLGAPLFISEPTCMPRETIKNMTDFTNLNTLTFVGGTNLIQNSSKPSNPCPS